MTLKNKILHKIKHSLRWKGSVRSFVSDAIIAVLFWHITSSTYSRWANWIKRAWDTEGHAVLSLPRQLNEQSPMLTQADQRYSAKFWWCSTSRAAEGERVLVKSQGLHTVLRLQPISESIFSAELLFPHPAPSTLKEKKHLYHYWPVFRRVTIADQLNSLPL